LHRKEDAMDHIVTTVTAASPMLLSLDGMLAVLNIIGGDSCSDQTSLQEC